MGPSTWVDTHGHLFMIDDDPHDVLDRAAHAGVAWLVCPGIDVASTEKARDLAAAFPTKVLWSAGLHPHDAEEWPVVRDRIAELATASHAIGECGLDWYRDLAPRAAQLAAFSDHLELAAELRKPIIVHCRDAFSDVYDAIARHDLGERAVLHCWTGGPRWTRRFSALGVSFSFAGPLTYDTADTLRRAADVVPPERTMVETDAPYLTPEPIRTTGTRAAGSDFVTNEPAHVAVTGAALATVWGVDTDEVARITSANAQRVFGGPDG
jgi:TatD DNase family protein